MASVALALSMWHAPITVSERSRLQVSPGATPPASPAPDYEADYPSGVPKVGGVPLDSAESAVFIRFLTHLISNYRSFV